MLINGEFQNIGDSLTIVLDPVQDATDIDNFSDVTTEAGNKIFTKEFRYSNDYHFTWSAWTELTQVNLQAVSLDPLKLLYIEIRYTRAGTDASGILEWSYFDMQVNVDPDQVKTLYPVIFENSNQIFGDIFVNDVDWQTYCLNLTKKVLGRNSLAQFVERTDENYYFVKTFCCYLSLYYIHAKQFENLYSNEKLLRDYLTQKGVFVCGNETLTELQAITNNYYSKIRKRGTPDVVDELKRVLCYDECDEYIFYLINNNNSGWHVDRNSPNFATLDETWEINKFPDKAGTIENKDNYLYRNYGGVSLVSDINPESEAINVLNMAASGLETGIKYDISFDSDNPFLLKVDPGLDYEISFIIKQSAVIDLEFGIDAWDCNGNQVDCIDIVTGGVLNEFINQSFNLYPTSEYVKVSAVLFNKNEPLRSLTNGTLSIGIGKHLKMPSDIVYIYPKIVFKGTFDVRIYGIRAALHEHVFPLASFVGLARYVLAYLKNNSLSKSENEVIAIIDKYLVPFSSHFELNSL